MKRGGHIRFWYIALACVLLCAWADWAIGSEDLPARLQARFFPDSVRVGDIVGLTLTYRLPEGAHLTSEPRIKGLDGLTIQDLQLGKGEILIRLLVDRLDQFKTGPLSLSYINKEGKEASLSAEPVQLTVLSNLGKNPGDAQLKPIYGIMPTRSGIGKYLVWAVIALAACATGIGIFLWLKRRGNRGGQPLFQEPPHTMARKEIQNLEAQKLFEKGHIKEFYFRFSKIMRRYLESLRGFPAAEYTTQEIASHIHDPQDRQILPLLQDADLVKFADLTPTSARKDDEIEKARAYISETGILFEEDLPGKGVHNNTIRSDRRRMMKMEETGR